MKPLNEIRDELAKDCVRVWEHKKALVGEMNIFHPAFSGYCYGFDAGYALAQKQAKEIIDIATNYSAGYHCSCGDCFKCDFHLALAAYKKRIGENE